MKQRLLPLLALLVLQVVAFGQADSCFTLYIRPTLLGAPYYDIFPITVTNQTQGTTFTMSDSLLHNCTLTGVEDFEARGFSLSAVYPNPSEGKAEVKLTTARDGEVVLQLFDEVGRLKASSTVALEQGTHTVEVSLSGRGLHILRATSHGQSVHAKIVNLASSGHFDAVRVSNSAGIAQDIPAMKTQQNVNIGDVLHIPGIGSSTHIIDSVRSGLFVVSVRESKYWNIHQADTLFWDANSLKHRLVAIPLPYDNAFIDDYNPDYLIWKYIEFQDSTFYVQSNPICPISNMSMMVNHFPFENGFIEFYGEMYDLVRVLPLSSGSYKYRITQYPVENDPYCLRCQGQMDVFSMDGTFIMRRYLKLRPGNFPNAFIMQRGTADPDDWFGEMPPVMNLFIVR
ncbi:MAG: T9SS type A sorting domain-containing protein [Bacteroidales bacterium]|nr:T9SS type A sorting domain-containing protein [Bacteroidales bacterium]